MRPPLSEALDPGVFRVAAAVRYSLKRLYPHNRRCRNLCSISACAVVTLCRERDIPAEIRGGVYRFVPPIERPVFGEDAHIRVSRFPRKNAPHAWVEHRRNYIDVTLTQFEPDAPEVAVLPMEDWRYAGKLEELEFVRLMLGLLGYTNEEFARLVNYARKLLNASTPPAPSAQN